MIFGARSMAKVCFGFKNYTPVKSIGNERACTPNPPEEFLGKVATTSPANNIKNVKFKTTTQKMEYLNKKSALSQNKLNNYNMRTSLCPKKFSKRLST